jgi:hypothetical protein
VPIVVENYAHVLNIRALRFTAGTVQIKGTSTYFTPPRSYIHIN